MVAVGKATSPRSQALRQLHTAAFEPLVEQTQDGVAQAKTETQEAKVTKLTSKATKVSVRQGNQFGVSLLQSSLCRGPGSYLVKISWGNQMPRSLEEALQQN